MNTNENNNLDYLDTRVLKKDSKKESDEIDDDWLFYDDEEDFYDEDDWLYDDGEDFLDDDDF